MKTLTNLCLLTLILLLAGWFLYATVQKYMLDARNAQG